MKKIVKRVSAAVIALAVVLTAVMLDVPGMTASAASSGTCGTGLTWTLDDNGTLTISGSGQMTGYGSTTSSKSPWKDSSEITSIVIENGVTSIGDRVFYNVVNLSSVTIANSVTQISQMAFIDCKKLEEITIPDSVTYIQNEVFRNCSNLRKITLPKNLRFISYYTFYGCTALESIIIPDSVTSIGNSAFEGCTSLKSITVPNSVTTIGKSAFEGCVKLSGKIEIPSTVTSIGKMAFQDCGGLTEVTVGGKTPPELGTDAFKNTGVTAIYVPCGAVDAYKNAENWSAYADIITNDGHKVDIHIAAKDATCTEAGNIEYWTCGCGEKKYSGADGMTVITDVSGDPALGHSWSDSWSMDGTNHWHICTRSDCGEKKDNASHSGGTATCQKKAACTVCGREYGSAGAHDYSTNWTTSDTQHWHECQTTGCTSTSGTKNHTFVQKSDGTNHWDECSVCGYKKDETAHSWSDWTLTTEPTLNTTGTAERACSCGEKQTKTDVPALTDTIWTKSNRTDPTLDGTGSEDYTSTDYGEVTITIPALSDKTVWTKTSHKDATEEAEGEDVYESTDYGMVTVILPALDHTHVWGDWEITKAPTLNDEGTAKRVCTKDDTHIDTETLPVLTDNTVWTKVSGSRKDPTIKDKGSEDYTSEYGTVTLSIPELSNETAWTKVDRTDPTLDGTGSEEYTSDDYGEVTITIPKLTDPIWIKDDSQHVEPTEEDTGKDVYTSEYGEVEVVLPVKEHTHAWGNWSIKTAPTLTSTGIAERVCTKDSTHKDTTELPELTNTTVWTKDEDQHVDPTEDNDGKDVYTSEYGEVTDVLPALGHTHNWGNWTIATAPTLTETGTAKRVCTKNAEHTETKALPILADTSVWTKVDDKHVDPTEDKNGKDVYTSEYGEVTDILPALGHTHEWGKWTITTAPTLTETGTAQRVCTLNDTHIDTKTLPVLTDNSVWTKDENKHVPPTEQTEGEDVYTSEYGKVTNPLDKLPHTHDDPLKYVPEVKPTEDDDGVKEHWHCDGCGKDFEDKDGTKEVTADDLKIGKIKTEVQAPTNVPKPEIATSKEKLISAALTDDEQKKVNEGTDIKIILKVEDASSTVSAEDKGNVETAIGNLTDHKLGQYLDVTLLKKIGEEREQKITETNAPIKVTFEIPEVLRGKAEYSVIRVHDGTATILPDLDSKPNTVTIETDKFSTYALTYKEKTTTSDSGNDSNGENPGGNSDTTSNVDNSSDTTSNGSDTNSSGGTSSSDESNHAPSESSPSEDNGNPSTGIAVSLVPLTAALAAMVIIAKHRRK